VQKLQRTISQNSKASLDRAAVRAYQSASHELFPGKPQRYLRQLADFRHVEASCRLHYQSRPQGRASEWGKFLKHAINDFLKNPPLENGGGFYFSTVEVRQQPRRPKP